MNPVTAAPGLALVYGAQSPLKTDVQPLIAVDSVPRSNVVLGQDTHVSDTQTYSRLGALPGGQSRYVWERNSQDRLSALMHTAFQPGGGGGRFQGLGAALLEQLSQNGGRRISQSLLLLGDSAPTDAASLKLQQSHLRGDAANSLSFELTTASGATVRLSLASGEQGLAVDAEVIGGELSDAELKGVGDLASGLQSAIDGLSQVPPRLQLGSLLKLDPQVFTSLQLNAKLQNLDGTVQTFDLQLGSGTRSLSVNGPAGQVSLSLDTQNGELLGTAAQRQAGISHYLSQFDAAQTRGKGDEQLMKLFRDAFTQLNEIDNTPPARSPDTASLSQKDRALLSGLADFSASVSAAPRQINPMRQGEAQTFALRASQSTAISGLGTDDLSVQQTSQSKLAASFYTGLGTAAVAELTSDRKTQNYRYHEVSDQASNTVRLAYAKGKLIEASAVQQASREERIRTYRDGEVTDDVSTPQAASRSSNLLSLLNDTFEAERVAQRDRGISILEQALQPQRKHWQLQGNPFNLAA